LDLQAFKRVDSLGHSPSLDLVNADGDRVIRLFLDGDSAEVSEVTVMGQNVVSFSASGAHAVDVVLPPDLVDVEISQLEFLVLSSKYTGRRPTVEILFAIGRNAAIIKGNDVLVQVWLRFFLMTPGTDPEFPEDGVGVLKLAGKITSRNLSTTQGHLARMHNQCKRQILNRQLSLRKRSIMRDPRELLRDAILDGVQLEGGVLSIFTSLIDGLGNRISVPTRV